jgi:hypothetical protein
MLLCICFTPHYTIQPVISGCADTVVMLATLGPLRVSRVPPPVIEMIVIVLVMIGVAAKKEGTYE